MGGLLSSLNTPYTGLTGHQVMVDTTSNNIANASNEFYSRQRVRASAETPLLKSSGNVVGQGLEIMSVERAHNEYTFMRYKKASMEKTFSETSFSALREASAYYPEVDKVGIFNDLQKYFTAWQDFSTRPGDAAQKEALVSQTENLTHIIQETRGRFRDLQLRLNDELKVVVEDVNRMAKEIAELNKQIVEYERRDINQKANDLRDKRDEYEFRINELIGCEVFKQNVQGSACVDKNIADFDDSYTLTIGGKSIIDETGFHPLVIDGPHNADGIYSIKYVPSDHKPSNITNALVEGKVGAILDLIKTESSLGCNGQIGKLQKYIDDLDSFANGIIEATNNIYAESARKGAISDKINLSATDSLVGSGYNVREGSFDVVMYNKKGEPLATRSVKIDGLTSINDVVAQLNANIDDNNDGDAQNDFDDKFEAVFDPMSGVFSIRAKNQSEDLTISIQDKGSNFAGSFGINKFFSGKDASDIQIAEEFRKEPTLLRAHREAVEGNKEMANKILQLQYDKVKFRGKDGEDKEETINGYFRYITSIVASDTSSAKMTLDTKTALYTSVKQEHKMISEVSVDEELVNLIRFQSGYSANAKIVTAIDEMINTLLGMK